MERIRKQSKEKVAQRGCSLLKIVQEGILDEAAQLRTKAGSQP